MREGAADADILEHVLFEVEFHAADRIGILIAVGLEAEARQLFQPVQIAIGDRRAGREIDFTGFDGNRASRSIRNEANNQLVEIGARRIPIVGIALKNDMTAPHPLLELERTRADRREIDRIFGHLRTLIKMFRHDGRFGGGKRGYQIGRGFGKNQNRRQLVRRLDSSEVQECIAAARMHFLDGIDGERHVSGGEWLAVMPFHAGPQIEGVTQTIRAHIP